MEEPKDEELVEKGKISVPPGRSMDYLMNKWRGNMTESQRKDAERDYVLLMAYLAYEMYGATTVDLKKLKDQDLIELRSRILPILWKESVRNYRIWGAITGTALLSVFLFMHLMFTVGAFGFIFCVISFLNAMIFTVYSTVREREDCGLKFLNLHNKLYGKNDNGQFPEDYKESLKYLEKKYFDGKYYMDLLRDDLQRRY